MKIGIMQPYFFPYLGYFSLIKYTDKWVVFDKIQYIRHGWGNRNRVLKPTEGWQYIIVPLQKHSRNTLIKDIVIKENTDWKARITKQLEHYKKKAPNYRQVVEVLKSCFTLKTNSLTYLNTHLLKKTCEYIGIHFNYEIFSEMNLAIGNVNDPGEWALRISEAVGAEEYINPPGGEKIFDRRKFEEVNIKLKFLKVNLTEYNQRRSTFEPGLSIVDVMMFNSQEEIKNMLDNYLFE